MAKTKEKLFAGQEDMVNTVVKAGAITTPDKIKEMEKV